MNLPILVEIRCITELNPPRYISKNGEQPIEITLCGRHMGDIVLGYGENVYYCKECKQTFHVKQTNDGNLEYHKIPANYRKEYHRDGVITEVNNG